MAYVCTRFFRLSHAGPAHSRVASVAVSNDDLKLAVSTGSGTRILDVKSHAYSTCIRSHKNGVVATAEASHCDQFATAGKDGTIRVWEIQSGAKGTNLQQVLILLPPSISSM